MPKRTPTEIEVEAWEILRQAEDKAWVALAHGKFSLFGYWGAKVVQFRELLGQASEPSPFRELVKLAKDRKSH